MCGDTKHHKSVQERYRSLGCLSSCIALVLIYGVYSLKFLSTAGFEIRSLIQFRARAFWAAHAAASLPCVHFGGGGVSVEAGPAALLLLAAIMASGGR